MRAGTTLLLVSLIVGSLVGPTAVAQDATAEHVVRELYDLVSTQPDEEIDWDRARSLFLDEALIFMRVSREDNALFTLDEWVADFVKFVNEANVKESGFTEEIFALEATEVRNVAHVLVRYGSRYPTRDRPPQMGIDSVHLVRNDGEWRILSIVNEIPRSEEEIPAVIR